MSPPAIPTFLAVAAICLTIVAFGLRTGKTLGIAFRSRLIARRRQEPALYWASLTIFAAFGLFVGGVAVAILLTPQ
jgi:hypothetical protein